MPILSFACVDTEALFTTGKNRRFVNIKSVAERKLGPARRGTLGELHEGPAG